MDKKTDINKELQELSASFGKISEDFKVLIAAKPKAPAPDPDGK